MKEKYKYIFCILVYRSDDDIQQCLNSIKKKISDYKVVIVNSFYDDITAKRFEEIARKNCAAFINVENRGYGAGNNIGIVYANSHYEFDYLVISNPDIAIEKFTEPTDRNVAHILAPVIKNLRGKNQNPYWIKKNDVSERLLYEGMKRKNNFIYYMGVAINKIARELGLIKFMRSEEREKQIYAAHGSFMMVSRKVFEKVPLLYDENMFLFAEEAYLAHIFEREEIPIFLTKDIIIRHKEDGSVGVSNIDQNAIERDSMIYYYEKINRKN